VRSAPRSYRKTCDCRPETPGTGIAILLLSCVSEKPIEPLKPSVNHDRSGLWATDPLDEFSSERPGSISPASPLPSPNTRVRPRPPVRRSEPRRANLALEPVPPGPDVKNRRGLWSFASGSAFGALGCVILFSWLTTSQQPRAEQFVHASEPVSQAPPPTPVSSSVSVTPPVAERAFPKASEEPAKKESFVGSLRIDSTPPGARVFIDRQEAGATPLVVSDLSAGSHAVRVEADDHLPWSSAIRVIADQRTRVHTTLAPIDSAPVHP
jgi:hypothetical protein